MMAKWFARGPGYSPTKVIEADVRAGGKYRIEVSDGKTLYRGSGTYREVQPPEKLVFTWTWEHDDFPESLVTATFQPVGQSNFTEVVLTHERLPERALEPHRQGWEECFDVLEKAMREGA
jgi:uncharacterized protein YndB with AHSA1/START domain